MTSYAIAMADRRPVLAQDTLVGLGLMGDHSDVVGDCEANGLVRMASATPIAATTRTRQRRCGFEASLVHRNIDQKMAVAKTVVSRTISSLQEIIRPYRKVTEDGLRPREGR